MKRVLSLFLSCIFVLGVCFSTPVIASATEPATFVVDGNVFQCEENNECSIKTWGDTEVEVLEVPATVDNGDVSYTITGILSGAFSGCEKLESITIKSNVTTIESGAFDNCTNLTSIVYEGHNIEWENAFEGELAEGVNVTTSCSKGNENIIYVAAGNEITVKCNGCSEEFGTITLEAPVLPDGAESLVYDGTAKEATVKVEGITGLDEIPAVSYGGAGEEPINAGTYTAKLTLEANAESGIEEVSATVNFSITPKSIIEENVTLTNSVVTYTGSEQLPEITVKDGEKILNTETTDYTVKYKATVDAKEYIENLDFTNVGTIFVEVVGTNNYKDTVTREYVINKAPLTITAKTESVIKNNLSLTVEDVVAVGLQGSDVLSGITITTNPETDGKTVGEFQLAPSAAVIKRGDNDVTANYEVAYTAGTLNVTDCDGHTGGEATCVNQAICDKCHEGYDGLADHSWEFVASEATITATCQTDGCAFNTAPVEITLTAPTDDLVYDGSEKTADVTVSAENSGIEIPEIVYSGDRRNVTEDGYTATITLGDGENVATATINLKITSKPLAEKDIEITGLESSYVYTGSAIEPSVVVKDGNDILVKDRDYTVEYSNNTEVSTEVNPATVTITFNGNYSGEVTKTFEIVAHKHDWTFAIIEDENENKISATCTDSNCIYHETGEIFSLIINSNENLVYDNNVKNNPVNIDYSANAQNAFGEEFLNKLSVSYSYNGEPCTVKNAGIYTATLVMGEGENSATITKTFEITPKIVNVTLKDSSGTYDGSDHVFELIFDDSSLVKNSDYYVSCTEDTINVGEIYVTVELSNPNYVFGFEEDETPKRTTNLPYEIKPKQVSEIDVVLASNDYTYTGVAFEPAVTVKINGEDTALVNTEYEVKYTNNKNAGTATVTVTLTDNYISAGAEATSVIASKNFTIAKATPTASYFTFTKPESLNYDGKPKVATIDCGADIGDVTVKYYSGETLLNNAPVEPGTYTVKLQVKENNNYNSATLENEAWTFTIIACEHKWENGVCKICNTECEHEFDSPEITKNPTCNAPGELTWVCAVCKYSKITTVNPNGDGKAHDWSGDYIVTKAATCVSEGVETKTCKNGCGEETTRKIAIDAEAHVMGEWITTEQTCVADGKKVRTCTLGCGATETEVIKADNKSHKLPDEWTVTKEANCVENGEKVKACLNEGCKHIVKETILADGESHNLGEWEVTIPAKCTIKGEVTQSCQNGDCTYKVTANLKPDGKTHDFAKDFTVIEATCISTGSKFRACENEGCKEVTEKTEIAIDPDAHKNVETINVKQPTCEEKGYTGDEHCNDCKKTFDPGIEVDALGHTESDWIVDKEATFTEEGARHTICNVCKKEIKKEVIKKLTLATPSPKAYNKTSSIKVKWTDVDNALTYNVYRSDFVNNDWTKWKKIGTVKQGVGEFSDKNVVAGKQYKYTVKAYNGEFKSSIKTSNKLTFIAPVKPALTITTTGIILKWDTVLGADKYVVYRSQLVDGKWSDWKKLSTVKDGKTSTTDTTAESGVTYKYSVRAYIGSSYTERKSSKTIVFLAQPTLKISNTEAGIKGSWKTINGATGYVITRAEYNENTKKFGTAIKLGTAGATAKSFTDKTAKAGVKYKYTLTAINGTYSSVVSSGKVIRQLGEPVVTIENANGAIKGKWTQVTGATKYTVYRSELVDGKWTSWKNLGTTGATAKSFTDKTVKSGVNYKYTVKAINGGSKSSVGASNKVVYLSRPEPKAVNSIYGVKVNWNAITGAESYIVYRKEYVNKKWTEWQQIGTSESNSYIDSTAVSGVKYKYTIHAVNGGSLSARKASSSLLHVATPTATVKATEKAINVSWGQVGGATKYVVYRQVLGADGKWSASTKIASLKGVLEFTDTTAEAGNTYRYKVVAYNGKVKSSSNATDSILVSKA